MKLAMMMMVMTAMMMMTLEMMMIMMIILYYMILFALDKKYQLQVSLVKNQDTAGLARFKSSDLNH